MGQGFPLLPSRDTFGPELENWGEVTNPKREIGHQTFGLAWWQLAAVSQLVPIARVTVSAAGARVSSREGWNPNGKDALRPTCSRSAQGVYVVTYQGSYPDETNVAQSLLLADGKVSVQGDSGGVDKNIVGVATFAGNVVTVKITVANTNALTDARFVLEVWT